MSDTQSQAKAFVISKRQEGWTLAEIAGALSVTVGALNMFMRRRGMARNHWGRNQYTERKRAAGRA